MKIHKEGYATLTVLFISLILLNLVVFLFFCDCLPVRIISIVVSLLLFLFILQFFRSPKRIPVIKDNAIISPADGTVVVIENTYEHEYLKDDRIQISIFMSTWNVHINWFPIAGIVSYFKYHPGKFLLARNPKSSTENERTTVVVKSKNNVEVLFRQIAGIVARRIVCNAVVGNETKAGEQVGFIKFGSRVDVLLPIGTKINVKLGQKVTGTQTVIAELV